MQEVRSVTTASAGTYSPSAPLSIFAFLITAGVAPLMIFIGPLLVGAWVDILGLGEDQAARVYSAHMAGCARVISLFLLLISRLLNLREG